MFFRIFLIILLLSSSNAVWNPIYKEKILPEVIEIPPSNESPPPENISIYYSALLGSVFGVLITSGFFYGTKKYYRMSERDSMGDHEESSTSLVEESLKEVPHPSDQDSKDTESVHLITNAELVTPEDISIDLQLDSDPIEDDSQQRTMAESASEETSPVSLPTAKETETVSKSKSLPNSPRDASRLPKFNEGENKNVRSLSLARRQVKKETFPSRLTDEHGSDQCGCNSKLALETLEKEVEDLRKSASNAERMKRDSLRALNTTKKEMLASGSTIKEMGKERDKLKEEIQALKREKREAVRVANARWRQKLVHLQEAMKIDLSSELSKSEHSSGTKGSSSSKLDSSPRKTDFTCGRRGLAWDKARSASEKTRNKDSRTALRSTKIDSTKSSSPRNALIVPVCFKSSVEKGKTKYDKGCENNLVDESKEENKSGEIDRGRDDNEDVCKDVTKEEDQDDCRNIITKGNNDDDKNDNSHTAASDDVKDIKQDTNSTIADNEESISTEKAMITETMTMQRCDLQEEKSKDELNGETNDLGVVESEETYGGKNFTLRDKSEAELSDDFEFDFGEEELERYNSTELDHYSASSQTFSVSITEFNREDRERENDEPNETEIKTMNTFEVCEQNIPEVSKSDEADTVSKLESDKSKVDDYNGESEQPLSSSQGSEELPEVISPKVDCPADVTDNVQRGAIPRPMAQQQHQRSMISKSHSVCKDNSKDVDNCVKSSTSGYISPGKSAASVATALLRSKPPKPNTPPNKQRRTRNDSSMVKSLLTRPSTMGCKVGDRECSSFVKVTKNVCVVKTCGPDEQSSDNGEKTNEYTSNGIKSCLDSSCVMTTEGKNTEQNVVGETNRKPLTEIFHSEDTFWVKFDGGSRNDFPPTPSNEVKQATEIENKPDPNHLEGKVSEKEENAEESLGGDIVQIPEAIANNTCEPMAIEETNDLEKCRNITKDAERCIQNIIDLGPSFTDEDKVTLEYLLDRLNPLDDFLQVSSFNSTLESVPTGMDNERKPSLNPPEKSNSERVNATQEKERQHASMRSVNECASGNKDGESTKGLAEKLSRYFVYDPERLAESFLAKIKEPSIEE